MNWRITTIIQMACISIAIFGLYVVKLTVEGVQRDVTALQQEDKKEHEALHLLTAEWAYLNRPERLHKLAEEHLALVPLDSKRIGEIKALPAAYNEDAQPAETKAQPPLYQPTSDNGDH